MPVLNKSNRITEIELALQDENSRLASINKALMDNSQYGIVMTDSDGIVTEFNRTAEALLSQKSEQILGNHVQNVPEIVNYIIEVLNEGKRFEKVHVSIGNKYNQISLLDALPLKDEKNKLIGAFVQLHDITEAFRVHEQFIHMENHDKQTGLPNRKYLLDKLKNAMRGNEPIQEGNGFGVFHIGLDRFKNINDSLGFTSGNQVLQNIIQRLKDSLKADEFIARVGGDEFVIVVPYEGEKEILRTSEKLESLFSDPFVMKEYEFHMTASIGIAMYPVDASTPEELLHNANVAMSHAEKNGKNQCIFYTKELDFDSQEKILLEASFRKALDADELILHYQPKINIRTGLISGVEALVRWQHPEKGLIPPAEFIPMAEETGLISQLDKWVLRKACEQNKQWQDMGLPLISVAVNLSSAQFMSHELIGLVETVLKETGLKAEYLELEITETMAMDVEHAIPTLERLNTLGVKISLDDFGTGYSSMNYLTRFAINQLKIDRSFIWNIGNGGSDSIIVSTMIRMAHSLGLKVVAEGVEDHEQLQFLNEHGCDEVQGFFYSKPVPAEDIKKNFLAASNGKRKTDILNSSI